MSTRPLVAFVLIALQAMSARASDAATAASATKSPADLSAAPAAQPATLETPAAASKPDASGTSPSAASGAAPVPTAAAVAPVTAAAAAAVGATGAGPTSSTALPPPPPPPGLVRLRKMVEVGGSVVGSSAEWGVGASARFLFRQSDVVVSTSFDRIVGARTLGLVGLGAERLTTHGFTVLGQGLFGFDAAGRGGAGLHAAAGARLGLEWPVEKHHVDTWSVSLSGITDLSRSPDAFGERLPVMTMWMTASVGFGLGDH